MDEPVVSSLRPDKDVQKILLSTPAPFVGELVSDDLLLALAWPPFYQGSLPSWFGGRESYLNRTPVVLAFRTRQAIGDKKNLAPRVDDIIDRVASTLSVFFGKRFDIHGPLESSGFFMVPDLSAFTTPCNPGTRFTDGQPRADHSFDLNFAQFGRALRLLDVTEHPRFDAFHSAAQFYRRALISVESSPEEAYLNLITAGEIITGGSELTDEESIPTDVLTALRKIESTVNNGRKLTAPLRHHLLGATRSFVSALIKLIDDDFFGRTEAKDKFAALTKSDFRDRLSAAYKVRSGFVHAGVSFGGWTVSQLGSWEVFPGAPVTGDPKLDSILSAAPLFGGMERIIRYALLRFASDMGVNIEPDSLDNGNEAGD